MEQTFNKRHANEILKPSGFGRYFKIKKNGVWPEVKRDPSLETETELFRWRPARAYKANETKEVAKTPMLPIPFTARQLAAFMLEGVGALVADFYGDWRDAPDAKSLNHVDPDSSARTAIVQAYEARREAERIVGAYPKALEVAAEQARKAYNDANQAANEREGVFAMKPGTDESKARRARALASISVQKSEMEVTAGIFRTESELWLKNMVRHLLKPELAQNIAKSVSIATESSSAQQQRPMKKSALVATLKHEWKSIEADIGEASRNGLKDAAHTGKHGEWCVTKARAWAIRRGKLSPSVPANHWPEVWPSSVKQHRI